MHMNGKYMMFYLIVMIGSRGHFGPNKTTQKMLECGLYWSAIFKDAFEYVKRCNVCQRSRNNSRKHEMPLQDILEYDCLMCGVLIYGAFSIL